MSRLTIFLISFILFLSILGNAQEYNQKEVRKIRKFLIEFDQAAINKDTVLLKKLIYPFVYEEENIQNQAIDKVLQNDETCTIDYCYSHQAFAIIKDSLFSKFSPMEAHIRDIFKEPVEAKLVFDQFSDRELPLLLYNDAIVILIMQKKQIRIFFWEGINHLNQ